MAQLIEPGFAENREDDVTGKQSWGGHCFLGPGKPAESQITMRPSKWRETIICEACPDTIWFSHVK